MKGQFFPYKDENVAESFPYVNTALILVNVVVFFWSIFNFEYVIMTFGFIPANASVITIFTSMFLHGSLGHLFGNMWYLFIFGDNVEDKFGKFKYLIFYLISGIAATGLHWLSSPVSTIPTVGASGAISGVLGAYLALFPKVKVRVLGPYFIMFRLSAKYLIGFWFVLQLLFGVMGLFGASSGIAFFAHIGGFVFGYFITKGLKKKKKRRFRVFG
jgi:membrane associated rhomboid family serine protease